MRRRFVTLALLIAVAAFFAAPREHALAADPPTITAVNPSSGTANAFVTVFGTGFQPGAMVIFGGTLSTSVSFVTTNQLNVQVPSTISGAIPVQVVNPDAQSASWTGFTYSGTPAGNNGSVWVAGINPGSGINGQPVHITGAGFEQGATVFFGSVSAENVVWMTSGYLMAYPPIGSGTVAVKVVNPNGQSATAPTNFTYTGTATGGTSTGSVVITSVSPGNVSAGTSVTISGTGFIVGATVSIGGYSATNVQVVASNLITAIAPAGPIGVVSVIVSNPGGQSGVFPGLSYGGATTTTTGSQPTVSSVSPTVGSSAGGTVVSISGAGFAAPATVTFGGVPATSVTVVSPNLITATTPPGTVGTVGVLVSNPSGAVGGLISGFTYELAWPRVTSVSPSTGALTGGTTLTITGSGFAPGATVTIGGQAAATVSAVTPTQITVTTPAGPPGNATVLVTNPGGAISGLATAFQYSSTPQPQPQVPLPGATTTITGVTPSTGPSAGGTAISIYGTGFQSGASVTISGISVSATVVSSTQITAVTPAVSGTGSVTVTVTNPGAATVSLPSAFTYGGTSSGGTSGTSGGTTSPLPAGGGLFVFAGGTNAQLLAQSGCSASTAVFWTTDSKGAWIGYIPSVPVAVVNAAWMALFPTSIPAGTPIFARC